MVYGTDPGIERPDYMRPLDPVHSRPMAYIDQTIIPDAEFGCDTRWLLPGDTSKTGQLIMDAHTLPHGSTIACVAYNYDDLTDLCAEAELWIGGGEARHQQGLLGLHPAGFVSGTVDRAQHQ